MFVVVNIVFLLLLSEIRTLGPDEDCPSLCTCKKIPQRTTSRSWKVRCGEKNKISNLNQLNLEPITHEIEQLDLSTNQFKKLNEKDFFEFSKLKKLDLSSNNITQIDISAFANLYNLERLKLNQNQISSITYGTFDSLVGLKQLDIADNPLTCDCALLWILEWSKEHNVKLIGNPKCSAPTLFKGRLLRKLKVGEDIHCKSPAATTLQSNIDMRPSYDQVVFEGDSLQLQCRASSISDVSNHTQVQWTWLNYNPKSKFSEVREETRFVASAGIIDTILRIPKLHHNHTGTWSCNFLSNNMNQSRGISVVVISKDSLYCPLTVTSDNKGFYGWPRTLFNHTVSQPCESINLNYDVSQQRAFYTCSGDGYWLNLNTSACVYTSETTKILEQFTHVNSSMVESAKHFRNYTSNLSIFKDVIDVVFAVRTMEQFLKYMPLEQIGGILIDIINNLLKLPKEYLKNAELEDRSCSKLRDIIEGLSYYTPANFLHKSDIASDVFTMKKDGFGGMKCTWYTISDDGTDKFFHCVTNDQADNLPEQGKIVIASVTVPETVFVQLEATQDPSLNNDTSQLFVSVQSNSNFFPDVNDTGDGKREAASAVIGVKIGNRTVVNLTDPVYVRLQVPSDVSYYEIDSVTPVWWDSELNNATGGWSSDGCHFTHHYQDHVIFYCHQLAYYAFLQDVVYPISGPMRLAHPAIYIGSFIFFTSLVCAITVYLLCYSTIQMAKKNKHSLVNSWLARVLLCLVFVSGVFQTEDRRLCQVVGLLLHYFTLSSILWVCITVHYMYKRLNPRPDIVQLQDDELSGPRPLHKPVLGLYLLAWGVPLIVCGIAAAIDIKNYASHSYCFLRSGPARSALYLPLFVLFVYILILFVLIRCSVRNSDANGHQSEGTQATENVDLDLLEPNFPESRSVRSISTKTASSDVEDAEHAPTTQLKAHIISLVLYVSIWLCGAFATVLPFHFSKYEEEIFSIAYAILATLLGAFTLFFYCVARNDVRSRCRLLNKWLGCRQSYFRSRNVSDAAHDLSQIQIRPFPAAHQNEAALEAQVTSRSSSRTSTQTKSVSYISNRLKQDFNIKDDSSEPKANNLNLIVLHRQQYRTQAVPNIIENPTNAAQVFFNPHQSTVARKFFKRQKRNMMKHSNLVSLGTRKLQSDSASVLSVAKVKKDNALVDQSIFGTNSKVNNTNIHVENYEVTSNENPNIFSYCTEEDDSVKQALVQNAVTNAAKLHKKQIIKQNLRQRDNTSNSISDKKMRSVSQQCSLEYSSENISDSLFDQDLSNHESASATPLKDVQESSKTPCCVYLRPNDPVVPREDCEVNTTEHIPESPSTNQIHLFQNPLFSRRLNSRSNSASVSDLDELYVQIRRPKSPRSRGYSKKYYRTDTSCCLSDPETSYQFNDDKASCIEYSSDVETCV